MTDATANPNSMRSGLESAFTWQNIGLQLGSGLISGGASWALGKLLDELFGKDDGIDLQQLFQFYADDIVRRVTKNVRREIQSAFTQENLRSLEAGVLVMSENCKLYEDTKDAEYPRAAEYLRAAEQKAINVSAEAQTLGLIALGTFQVVAGMKMSISKEQNHKKALVRQVKSAVDHVKDLQQHALFGAREGVGEATVLSWSGKSYYQRVGETHQLKIDGEVQEVPLSPPGRDYIPIEKYRKELIDERVKSVEDNIVKPSAAIVETWQEARHHLSDG